MHDLREWLTQMGYKYMTFTGKNQKVEGDVTVTDLLGETHILPAETLQEVFDGMPVKMFHADGEYQVGFDENNYMFYGLKPQE